jgi:8-amino-7-oxononanoate synthase
MTDFESELCDRLASLREQGLYRELRRIDTPQSARVQLDGRTYVNFSSNDYLGLANHPALKEAAIRAVERYGAGSGASRLISGSLAPHQELDETLARFKRTQAALAFSSGYAAALGTICSLMGTGDIILVDKLVHACIVDAARLCGAKMRVFRHNNLDDLERLLSWAAERAETLNRSVRIPKSRVLVVTESVFSMDGDHAPLREFVQLKNKYKAWLMVDEAHATGLYGENRRGLAEQLGVATEIEIQMGTLGKALGAAGGYICGSSSLITYLINRARSFIFSTAPVPAAAAAAIAGIRLVQSNEGNQRLNSLWQLVSHLPSELAPGASDNLSAIIPIHVGNETKAVERAKALRMRGIYIPAIRYPTVARGHARLRVTMTAAHTEADVEELIAGLAAFQSAAVP